MSDAPAPAPNELQQKYRQFIDMLPLTIAIAGLPHSEGRLYSEDQMEARVTSLRTAYRLARGLLKECLSGS